MAQPYQVTVNNKNLSIETEAAATLDIIGNGGDGQFHILKDGKSYRATLESVDYRSKTFNFVVNGTKYATKISDKYDRLIDQLGMKIGGTQVSGNIKAPMPGLVLEVIASVGQTVQKGDKVLILEAMKMENIIKATGDGTITAIHAEKGKAVEKGQLLIEIK